ncbi:MAG: hypothetical protein QW794_00185 [Thermosphaera sp.]
MKDMVPDFEAKRVKMTPMVDDLTFLSRAADPPLVPGRVWFRSDLRQLRWTPDGSMKVLVIPKMLVLTTWDDTTPYYTVDFSKTSGSTPYTAAVVRDAPAVGHKSVEETRSGGYDLQYHFALLKDYIISSRMWTRSYVGARISSNSTRANLLFTITHRNNVNRTIQDMSVPALRLYWSMSMLGYPNGSYGQLLVGSITFTSPPSYSFSPANPSIIYYRITEIPTTPVWLLYGYLDSWSINYGQWASLQNTSEFVFTVATEPPELEVVRELEVLAGFEAVIARWDGEVRLYLRSGEKGLILPLGRRVEVMEVKRRRIAFSSTSFDRARQEGGREGGDRFTVTVRLKTDKEDRNRLSDKWLLHLVEERDGVTVVFGDSEWDGDKYVYYITGLQHGNG